MSLMPAIAEVMVQKILDEIKTQVDENESTANQLKQIIATIFNLYETYHDLHSLMYAGLASSEHLKKWETVYEPIYEYMKYCLIIAKAKGDIRDTINEKETAKLMIGLIESAAEQIYIYDESSH